MPLAGLEHQQVHDGLRIGGRILNSRGAEALQHAAPALFARDRRLVEHQIQVNIDEPRGVFGAFKIAAHPIKAVCDSG